MEVAEKNGGRPKKRRWGLLLLAPPIAYTLYVLVAVFFGRVFIYPGASFMHFAPSGYLPEGTEILTRPVGGGEVHAWLRLPAGASADEPAPLAVVFHGNAELIENLGWSMDRYNTLGWAVLAVEYRGYGDAAGRPSERALVDDALHFIEIATARPDVDGGMVLYQGYSLGGAVAAAVAREREPQAVVLNSTFTSMDSMFAGYFLPPVAPDSFDTLGALRGFAGPVLITHGDADEIVPYAQGVRLAEGLGRPLLTHGGGHAGAPLQVEPNAAIAALLIELRNHRLLGDPMPLRWGRGPAHEDDPAR